MLYNPLARWGGLGSASLSDRFMNRTRHAGPRRRRTRSVVERLEERTLLSFTVIPQPNAAYLAATTGIPIPTPDFTPVSSITDGTETVSISPTMQTFQTLPGGWNLPPATQSAFPNTLFNTTPGGPITLTLSKPASEFGVEMQFTPFLLS
jgi:hypothetical protein